jgi:hypothetical protein
MCMATHINDAIRRRTARNLALFIAATLGIGWLGRFLDVVTGRPSTEGPRDTSLACRPAAVAVLLRAFASDGWREFPVLTAVDTQSSDSYGAPARQTFELARSGRQHLPRLPLATVAGGPPTPLLHQASDSQA